MPITYPFDTSGLSPDNYIQDELVQLNNSNDPIYKIILPSYSPFYLNNLSITHIDTSGTETTLTINQDYQPIFEYVAATRSIGQPIYGGIAIVNPLYHIGPFKISYQTLGGDWVADPNYVLETLANAAYNPRVIYWDQITNVQDLFPPNIHTQPITDVTTYQDLINAIADLANVIADPNIQSNNLDQHLVDFNNPHRVNKNQIDLGNVANLPLATDHEVTGLIDVEKYITLRQFIQLCKRTYLLEPSQLTININSSLNVHVSTTFLPDNITLFWTIYHISTKTTNFEEDKGTVIINHNEGDFTISTKLFTTIENLEFKIELRVNGYDGAVVAITEPMYITVTDTITPYDIYMSQCNYNSDNPTAAHYYLIDLF